MPADLHLHTYHSDGVRSPAEVVDLAVSFGLTTIAISDHDQLAGWRAAVPLAKAANIRLIPAIELSCAFDGSDVHLLAYAFDPRDSRIDAKLEMFREARDHRGDEIIRRLAAAGFSIDPERVAALCGGGALGRPHVARALIEAGHAVSIDDAFERLLVPGRPGFVPKARFAVREAVDLVHDAGGLLSVAHPTLYRNHERLIPRLLDVGVDAIEAYHPEVDEGWRTHYRSLAMERGAFVTGGSDDHGIENRCSIGTVSIDEREIEPILERLAASPR